MENSAYIFGKDLLPETCSTNIFAHMFSLAIPIRKREENL